MVLTHHSKILLATAAAAAFLLAPFSAFGVDDDPRNLPIPVVDRGRDKKFLQVDLRFGSSDVSTMDVTTKRGYFHRNTGDPPLLLVDVFDDDGNLVDSYDSWHPQWTHVTEADGSESLQIAETGDGSFRCGFKPNLRNLKVTDTTGDAPSVVADVDLRPAIRSFCEENPNDDDCERADLAILNMEVLPFTPLPLIGTPFPVEVRTTFANLGPAESIDATVRKTAVPAAGTGVTPVLVEQEKLDLAIGAPRDDLQSYEVSCTAVGDSSIALGAEIEMLTVAATDPIPGNNQGNASIDVNCVVPVSLEVGPCKKGLAVNVNAKKVKAYILTTQAGEDGNPIAFDAGEIELGSLRFGTRETLLSGAGTNDKRKKLRLLDLGIPGLAGDDDAACSEGGGSGDGDEDAFLMFPIVGSGLTETSTEACVLGNYRLAEGGTARFFGCDAIQVMATMQGKNKE